MPGAGGQLGTSSPPAPGLRIWRPPRRRRAVGGAGNVYQPDRREAGRPAPAPAREPGTLGTSRRATSRLSPPQAWAGAAGERAQAESPPTGQPRGNLRPGGQALLGAAVPQLHPAALEVACGRAARDFQRPPSAGRGARPHGVTSAAASPPRGSTSPPPIPGIPPGVPIAGPLPRPHPTGPPSRRGPPPDSAPIAHADRPQLGARAVQLQTLPRRAPTVARDGEGIPEN
uniref:basic proline-rich protein-like n=1 Tax=Urocitellus parryii TaxID=9999 RepID=UPI000E55B006|nr:basic proline-rich protein-like [Urocitellus parryii]